MSTIDAAVVIGRFQPVHQGHLALVREALLRAPQALVVLGSAHQARTPKNPFGWQEREAMLRATLNPADNARLAVLPVRDWYDEARWAQDVRQAVAKQAPAAKRIALVGHFKDASSSYLRAFPGWELIRMERQGPMDASTVRDAWFAATPETAHQALAALGDELPTAVREQLCRFAQTPAYSALQQEWRMLRAYRESWTSAPYPPVFVTVDALLRCQGHVLLIQRGHAPGKGLWALPGGFLEPRDTLWQSCLRELAEETHWPLPEVTMRAALQQVTVFDHPDRSQRGRTITHAHYFDLGNLPLPTVRADDDAAQVQWTPIEQLPGMEEAFFEDHFHILDHFLDLPRQAG